MKMGDGKYTGIGLDREELCLCCRKWRNAQEDMFARVDFRGFCYDCYGIIPDHLPEDQHVRFLTEIGKRRIKNE